MQNIIEIDGKKYTQTIEPYVEPIKVEYPYPKMVVTDVGMKKMWSNPPKGLIVHYHSGHADNRLNSPSVMEYNAKRFYYHCLEEDGTLYSPKVLDNDGKKITSFYTHGAHCGTKHHRDHIGLEIINSGKLREEDGKYLTWFDKEIPGERVRLSHEKHNVKKGFYEMFTKEQEKALIGLCLYLKEHYPNFSFDNVKGHDEVAPGYKQDPGGSLSLTMPEFRKLLKKIWKEQNG